MVEPRLGHPNLGLGIGLRTVHFPYILENHPAIDWFEKAAQAGSARARTNIGKIHARGENGVQDYRLATTELKKAAGDWLSIRVPMKQVNVTRGVRFSYSAASISQGADEEEPDYDWIVSRRVKWDSHELRRPIFDPNYDSAKDADITVVDLRSVGDEFTRGACKPLKI